LSFPPVHRAGYTSQVLSDSVAYTKHRGGAEVNVDDVKLAVETKLMREFHAPASVEDMRDRAAALNAIPLPELSNRPGIHVPQDDNLLGAHVQYFPRPGGVLIGEEGRRGAFSLHWFPYDHVRVVNAVP
jgi:transcription initiation factor TFIID subunit 9B